MKWPQPDNVLEEYETILKKNGCRCERPLVGYRPNVGPRCRLCNVVAETEKVITNVQANKPGERQ